MSVPERADPRPPESDGSGLELLAGPVRRQAGAVALPHLRAPALPADRELLALRVAGRRGGGRRRRRHGLQLGDRPHAARSRVRLAGAVHGRRRRSRRGRAGVRAAARRTGRRPRRRGGAIRALRGPRPSAARLPARGGGGADDDAARHGHERRDATPVRGAGPLARRRHARRAPGGARARVPGGTRGDRSRRVARAYLWRSRSRRRTRRRISVERGRAPRRRRFGATAELV